MKRRVVGELILEVGCGTTLKEVNHSKERYRAPFRPKVNADVYVDVKKPELNVENFIVADAQRLPFKSKAFMDVYASHLIEHLSNPLAFLKEARRVSQGALHLWLPNFFGENAWKDPTHLHAFSYYSLKKLLRKAGYSWIHVENVNISGRLPKLVRKIFTHLMLILIEELQIEAL